MIRCCAVLSRCPVTALLCLTRDASLADPVTVLVCLLCPLQILGTDYHDELFELIDPR